MKKRILSLITALALCLTLFPVGALAEENPGSGEGDTETPVTPPSQTKDGGVLTETQFGNDFLVVRFSESYKERLEKLEYKGASQEKIPPTLSDLDFWISDTKYSLPAEGSSLTASISEVRYGSSGTSSTTAPKDAGEYTVQATVTLTLADTTTPPAPGDGSGETGGNEDTEETKQSARETQTTSLTTDSLDFTIAQKEVTPVISGTVTKAYDGTTSYTPDSNTSPVNLTGVITADIGNVSVTGTYRFGGVDVGEYDFSATGLALTGSASGNYKLTSTQVEGQGQIIQAAPPSGTNLETTITVRNGRAHTYTYELASLLPALPAGQFYGENASNTAEYDLGNVSIAYTTFCATTDIKIEEGNLVIPIKETTHTEALNVGTITIKVTTNNFVVFNRTINLKSANKTEIAIGGLEPIRPPYDGTPQIGYSGAPTFSLRDTTATEEITGLTTSDLEYSYESSNRNLLDYGPTSTPPIEPGEYKVTIRIRDNHPDYTGETTLTFTITKAKVTVKALDRKIKVDEDVPTFTKPVRGTDYEVLGLAEGVELKVAPTMKYATVADSIMEGEFDILIDGAMVPDNDHYNPAIEYVPGKLIVTSLTEKEENPFSDVSEYSWYVTAVKYVYNEGLMMGTTSTLFSPTKSLTRGMLVTILYRMIGEEPVWNTMPFTDLVPGAYYIDAVRWASFNGIVNGYGDGRFGPNDVLTREQLAIILYNFTRYSGFSPNKAASLDAFVDAQYTTAAGYRALQWACAEKLIQGTGSTTLSPHSSALRAQVAVILMRYCTTIRIITPPSTDTTT